MRKILLSILFMSLLLTACVAKKDVDTSKKVVVVTTSFVEDMVKQLSGDTFEVETIIPAGEDPHLYIAKPSDLDKIKKADLLLYHGLHFEGKIQDLLQEKGIAITKDFDMDKLNTMEENSISIVDPHFWFDINLYKQAVTQVAKSLIEFEPSIKEDIEVKLEKYLDELDELDTYNKKLIQEIPKENRYLITPHDAFNYFSKSYGIEVIAPQGVSTDSEVSNKDLEETADFIVAHKVKAIFTESTTNPERIKKLQEIVKAKGFDVKVVSGHNNELFSDSLAPLGEKGDNFIDMYKHNVELISSNLK